MNLEKLVISGKATKDIWLEKLEKIDKINVKIFRKISNQAYEQLKYGNNENTISELETSFNKISEGIKKCIYVLEKDAQESEKDVYMDALRMRFLWVCEHIKKVEYMQNGFWVDFHEKISEKKKMIKKIRDIIAHTEGIEIYDYKMKRIIKDVFPTFKMIIDKTVFKKNQDGRWKIQTKDLKNLKPSNPGDKFTIDNRIPIISLEDNAFKILGIGRTKDNKLLFSSNTEG